MAVRARALAIVLAAMGFAPAAAQPAPPASVLAHNPTAAERAWVASTVYHLVKRYFAHWEGLPAGFDFDARYRAYLGEALAAPDRRGFSMATLRLIADLHNGHSSFTDEALYADPRPAPFYAEPVAGHWTVRVSRVAELAPGAVIVAVDGMPIETWVAPIRAIIAQSNDRARDSLVFLRAFMLPERFTLTLADGKHAPIDRARPLAPRRGQPRQEETTTVVRPDGTVVIAIPSFDEPKFESAAIAAVRAHMDAPLILFDVRWNGGGSTPGKLLETIMTRPYAGTIVATPLTVAEFDADGAFDPAQNPIPGATIRYGPVVTQPVAGAFAGRAAVLADRHCASACEDFVIRFKSGKRGPVLGEATWGSTGQPYRVRFSDLGMEVQVSTKREALPDGARFEGVGIAPDIAVPPLPSDFAAPGDPQRDRALAAVRNAS